MAQDLQDERDGPFWIVVGFQLPRAVLVHRRWNGRRERQREVLEAFYVALSGRSVTAGQGRAHPPRWRDAAYPTRMHLGVLVADLDAAERTGRGSWMSLPPGGCTSIRWVIRSACIPASPSLRTGLERWRAS